MKWSCYILPLALQKILRAIKEPPLTILSFTIIRIRSLPFFTSRFIFPRILLPFVHSLLFFIIIARWRIISRVSNRSFHLLVFNIAAFLVLEEDLQEEFDSEIDGGGN
jgi:hypothetical protein